MKTFAALLACVLLVPAARAQDAPAPPPPPPAKATVTVEILNLRSDGGVVRGHVYRTEAAYKSRTPSDSAQAKIQGGKATLVFEGIATGTAMISVFHDEDGDGKLKTNWLGMPKEGVGVSKDAKGFMGPPKFDDAKLELPPGPTATSIKLHYL